jgi:GTPase SAR1 family protein
MGNEQGTLTEEDLKKRAITKMDPTLQQKFSRGAHYNMKIVIRGDAGTGKSALWFRLQGRSFVSAHQPTEKIQISHIHWSYKVTDDIVKVEVWDVVDKAKKNASDALRTSNDDNIDLEIQAPSKVKPGLTTYEQLGLDASTVDVMKGAHAVIFTCDPSRLATWEYVKKEVFKLQGQKVYILILASFRDVGTDSWKVSKNQIAEFCRDQGDHVRFLESSMLNCYGLKGVKSFLNLPFLRLKREELEAALLRNNDEYNTVNQELQYITENEEYEKYEQSIKRREVATNTAPPPSPAKPAVQSTTGPPKEVPSVISPRTSTVPARSKSDQPNGNSNSNESKSGLFSFVAGFKDSISSKSNKPDEVVDDLRKLAEETKSGTRKPTAEASIDDFVVEEEGTDDWLADDPPTPSIISKPGSKKQPEVEDSATDRNPMVNFSDDEEELQFDDYKFESPVKNVTQQPIVAETKSKQQTKPAKPQFEDEDEDEVPEPNPLVTEDFGDIDVDFSAPPIVRNVTADKSPVKVSNIEKPAVVAPRPSEPIPNVTANVQRPTVSPNVSPQKPPPAAVTSNFEENGGGRGKDMRTNKGPVVNTDMDRRKNEARYENLDSSQEKKSSNVRQVQYEVMDDPEDDPFLTNNPGNPEPENGKDDNWDFLPQGDFDDNASSEAFFTALTPTYSNKSQAASAQKPPPRTDPISPRQQGDLGSSSDSESGRGGRGGPPRGAPAGRMNRGVRVRVRGGGPGRPGPPPGAAPGGPGPRGRGPVRGRAVSPPIPTPPDQF